MQIVKSYPDGLFNWIDLSTTDAAGAKAFYGPLFGWEFDDQPTDMGTIYTMCQIGGHNVAGLSEMMPEQAAQGMPPVWTSYVKHDNADAVAERIAASGGHLMMPPMDVMNEGRMLMAADPGGAVFGVWQPKNHIGAQLVNLPNTLVWNELQTRAKDDTRAFYNAVFGWTDAVDDTGYVMFKSDDRIQAGLLEMDDSWGDMPSSWSVYFRVEEVDAAAAKAEELGGNVLVPPTKAGEMGRFAVVQDPQGGIFTVMSFNGPVDPPPGYES